MRTASENRQWFVQQVHHIKAKIAACTQYPISAKFVIVELNRCNTTDEMWEVMQKFAGNGSCNGVHLCPDFKAYLEEICRIQTNPYSQSRSS